MSSAAVESLVTMPLERRGQRHPCVTTLRSKSVQGLSSIVLFFEHGTNLFEAHQMATQRLASAAPDLPILAKTPKGAAAAVRTSRVLHIGLTAKPKEKLGPGEPQGITQTEVSGVDGLGDPSRAGGRTGGRDVPRMASMTSNFKCCLKPAELSPLHCL